MIYHSIISIVLSQCSIALILLGSLFLPALQVTHRIMSYRFLHGQFSAPVMALRYEGDRCLCRLYPDVFWPSSAECKT